MSSTITPRPPRPLPVRPVTLQPPHRTTPGSGAPTEDRQDGGWTLLIALRPAVLSFLRRRCRDVHQAEDLAQDTLLRAVCYLSTLSRVDRPRSWAIQIAANVQRDHVRKESRQQLAPSYHPSFLAIPGTEPVPGDVEPGARYEIDGRHLDGDELVREVRALWGELLDRDRVVLSAYYSDGGSTRSAARACGVAHGLVKVRLFRARRRLELAVRDRLARA